MHDGIDRTCRFKLTYYKALRAQKIVKTPPSPAHLPPLVGSWAWTNQSHPEQRTQLHRQLDQPGQFLGKRCVANQRDKICHFIRGSRHLLIINIKPQMIFINVGFLAKDGGMRTNSPHTSNKVILIKRSPVFLQRGIPLGY